MLRRSYGRSAELSGQVVVVSGANMAIVSGSCARISGSRNGPSVSATQSGSVGQSQPMIAVWEWQDDLGCWRPYSGQVSAYIEQSLAPRGHRGGGPGSTSICLGQSDPSLSPYIIDVRSLKQFRQDTGECEYWVRSSLSLPILRRRGQCLALACLFLLVIRLGLVFLN